MPCTRRIQRFPVNHFGQSDQFMVLIDDINQPDTEQLILGRTSGFARFNKQSNLQIFGA